MFDVIIGNPPYVYYRNVSEETRNYIKERYKTAENRAFNLYYVFFELGYALLSRKGLLAFITPNNWTTLVSGKELREFLQKRKCVKKIIDFKEDQNFEAQTCTAITLISKQPNKSIDYSQIANDQEEKGKISYNAISPSRWKMGLTREQESLIRIERAGQPLQAVFDIRVGLATGADSLYYFESIAEDDNYYWINDNVKIEKEITRPCAKISKIDDIETDNNRIIFPYDKQGNVLKETVVKRKFPECWGYLTSIRKRLIRRKGGKELSPFYVYSRNQSLQSQGMKLLTPSYSKKPHFTLDMDATRYYINGRGLYLKDTPKGLFQQQHKITDIVILTVYCKILNSYIMDFYVKRNSHIISNGYYAYQKNDIKNFGIVDLSSSDMLQLYDMDDPKRVDKFLCEAYHVNCD